ncbi:unnamed protein product [Didymodactylos carnosus]|uniref:Uncharacterized protein n=1 Tax=Didymodactylos carnosus TaxID=1234261 RepID=A0A815PUI6_9BILA|nr:unnamed protein product [Didymodactylos carnosus]CAF4326794.1 unnamed protein product [Didymodactylos carnosus]
MSITEEKALKLWVIKMKATDEGAKLAQEHIELNRKEIDEMSVALMLGKLLREMGKYEQSLKYFQTFLQDPQDEDVARIYNNIEICHRLKGHYTKALKSLEHAYQLMIKHTPPRLKDSANSLLNMGIIFGDLGEYDKAFELYYKPLEIQEKYFGKVHLETSKTLNNIGLVYDERQDYTRALDYYRSCLEIEQKLLPSNHIDIATSLMNI